MNYPHIPEITNMQSEAIDIMKKYLLESFQQLQGVRRCGVLFSGGVDSSLAAILTRKFCAEVTLLTTCTEKSRDSQFALKAAELLNLNLVETRIDSECVWKVLPELIHAIERSQRMDVEIALPFFLSSREAKNRGIENLVSGQGPDELFAGYARHVEMFIQNGDEFLQKMLYDEVSKTQKFNIQRDERAITYNGVTAHFPYLDSQFVKIALSLPASWKVVPKGCPSRKVIFRQLAIEMGVPIELALKPKDATQYSSGSSRILIDSVRDHALTCKSISRKKANKIVQDVLNLIAFEIGLATYKPTIPELEIDLKPTHEFVSRLQSTTHQQ